MTPGRLRRRRGCLVRLALAAFAAVVALLAALVAAELWLGGPAHMEGPAQLRYMFEPDPEVGYRPAAGYRGDMLVEGRRVPVRFNSLGMRGPEYGPKPAGERRVLFLGDSITFGQGLEVDETFPQRYAVHAGGGVVAGIAAAPSLGPIDFAPFVRRVRDDFAPDLVVACVYLGNDWLDNFAISRTVIDGYPLDGWAARLAQSSWRARLCLRYGVAWRIETWLDRNLPPLAIDKSAAMLSDDERLLFDNRSRFLLFDDVTQPPWLDVVEQRMHTALAATRDAAGGTPLVVLALPTFAHVLPGRWEQLRDEWGLDRERYQRGRSQARLAALCSRLGVPFSDMTAALAEAGDPAALLLPHDLHYSARGCDVLGRALAATLP